MQANPSGIKTLPLNSPVSSTPGIFDNIGGRISIVKLPPSTFDSKKSAQAAVTSINLDKDALFDSDGYYTAKFDISADLSAQPPLKTALGSTNKNTFVSVQSEKLPGRQGYAFHLVTNTRHDATADAFKQWLAAQPAQFSIGAAIASPQYARVQQASDINHRAVVARVLQVLGVDKSIATKLDNKYLYANPAVVPRDLVKKSVLKNMAKYGVAARGQGDTAVVYQNALNMDEFTGDTIAVPLSFTDGVHILRKSPDLTATPRVQNKDANSLPLSSTDVDTAAEALTKDDTDAINNVVHWKGKLNKAHEVEIGMHVSSTITPEYVNNPSALSKYGLSKFVASNLETVALIPGGFGL